ncbi:MAG: hypothetical protein PHS41_03990, partial [Victivallaceae bacterium]|nr:hypothetical protein [Victivallaceae bacterium]
MSKLSFYCPFCFKKIHTYEVGFHCIECTKNKLGYKSIKQVQNLAASEYVYVEPPKPNFFTKIGLSASARRIQCAQCGSVLTSRACPHCNNELPVSIDKLSDITIAIIGAKNSGKSHYIALLIHRIKQLAGDFGWCLSPLDERTIGRYEQDFRRPLFTEFKPIEGTKSAETNTSVNQPLLYSLQMNKSRKKVILAFYDTAGEDLQDLSSIKELNRYIYTSSGIICLLDPLQLSMVREEFKRNIGGEANLPDVDTDTGTILSRVAILIHSGQIAENSKYQDAAKIKIPLAIAFSKIDALMVSDDVSASALMPESCELFHESRHKGCLDIGEFNNINALVKDWILAVDQTSNIVQQSSEFEKTAFFGFSSLGCNPQ